ncbi:ATP synthase F0 subunit B [Erysipelothrix aquatica]|uniref:F0F1 ATP synthase subunit B family protein n=1 Tax=Erysipelothrix aquatica TaxID=2683714 RepID=UPI001357FBA7|nr:ATP synthase F0 subunit B [Erysipelothrix aquatica]
MNLDIAAKLMPDPWTMAAQLAATFVIYIMYRKYLHEPVQKYLDARAERMAEEMKEAEAYRMEAKTMSAQAQEAYSESMDKLKIVEADMLRDAENKKQAIIDSAQEEIENEKIKMAEALKNEKAALYREVSTYMLDTAVAVNRKVLSERELDHSSMLQDLEKEMEAYDHKH